MTFSRLLPAAVAGLILASPVFAEDTAIQILDPYARSAGHHAKSGAAFMTIANTGSEDDRLVSVTSDAAKRVELHTHVMTDGVAKMRAIEGGIALPSGGSHEMARGGDHVMFMGLTAPLKDGATVRVTFTFEKAGDIDVDIPIDTAR